MCNNQYIVRNVRCIFIFKDFVQLLKLKANIMKHYEELIELGCFSREKLTEIVGTPAAANMIIYEYQKKGLIEKVKRDFYVVISLETKQPILSRYQIGSSIFEDACITHHSAFEVFGYGNQVFNECYVATEKRFSDFEYNGVAYHRVERKANLDVFSEDDMTVTSLEQTAVDSIRDYEKIAGLEEVIRCLLLIPGLDEKKVLNILANNNNGFLYQKCGYIFEELNNEFLFSKVFFKECRQKSSNSKRYLLKDSRDNVFNRKWNLYTPASLRKLVEKGDYYDTAE